MSTVKLRNYTRRPFAVDAIQVTVDNKEEVAELCKGYIFDDKKTNYIQVPVKKPANPRQAQAHVGDYVVYYQKGWKVYTEKAFTSTFQETVAVANDLAGFAARENHR